MCVGVVSLKVVVNCSRVHSAGVEGADHEFAGSIKQQEWAGCRHCGRMRNS